MKVILKQTVENLGSVGEVVSVRDGYGRNFLFPRGLAIACSEGNMKVLQDQKERVVQKDKREKAVFKDLAKKINDLSCTITVQAGTDGKLFGAVTNQDVHEALRNEGITVDKKAIILEEPIKKLGVFHVSIRLHTEVEAQLKVWVVQK